MKFQFHLSTALVLLLTTAAFMQLQLQPKRVLRETCGMERNSYVTLPSGFPMTALAQTFERANGSDVDYGSGEFKRSFEPIFPGFIVNLLFLGVLLVAAYAISENVLSRFQRTEPHTDDKIG